MSHDINRDVEMWEFRDLIGKRADPIWEEILSIADRNDGFLPGVWDAYPTLLAHSCRSTPSKVRSALGWLTVPRGSEQQPWVTLATNGTARVTNYLKYNPIRDEQKIPPGETKESPPSDPSLKEEPPKGVDKNNLDPGRDLVGNLKNIRDLIVKSDPTRSKKINQWIAKKRKEEQGDEDIAVKLYTLKMYEDRNGACRDPWAFLESQNGSGRLRGNSRPLRSGSPSAVKSQDR